MVLAKRHKESLADAIPYRNDVTVRYGGGIVRVVAVRAG